MSAADFLVELGTEELPPKALKTLSDAFADHLTAGLDAAHLRHGPVHAYCSPRRLAVLVEQLAERQPDTELEKLGPAVTAAFDKDGNPTKAAEGFARSNGVSVDQLERQHTDKGERLLFRAQQTGQPAAALLADLVSQALAQLPIPKRMRWGARRAEFVRPAHWLVLLHGEQVVPGTVLELSAGRESRGHRVHHPEPILIESPARYVEQLRAANVMVDANARRDSIHEQIHQAAQEAGGHILLDEDLLDEVTALVEWPVALVGRFEERFLNVPAEALISSMQEHQKYFPVVDDQGKLQPFFVFVANLDSADPAQVIDGNERVIRPRLSDAAFFYDTDRNHRLEQRRQQLSAVVFQAKLGTLFDKTERIAALAQHIAKQIDGNPDFAQRAGALSKADLVTEMVLEFDDLQGIMGHYYARNDGEPEEIAQALEEQYWPRFAGDQLPTTRTGMAVALADRLDTLTGIFGIGQPPTGSKDPFALRRAAIGVLRIIVESNLDLSLRDLINTAIAGHADNINQGSDLSEQILDYLIERFRAIYSEQDIPVAVFNAVAAKQLDNPLDIHSRVQAVHSFAQMPEAEALAAANKRVSNILAKEDIAQLPDAPDPNRFQEPAEQSLANSLTTAAEAVKPLLAKRDYAAALKQLAELRAAVDAFFDQVLVMSDDAQLRLNRLALLKHLRDQFLAIADISQLATK